MDKPRIFLGSSGKQGKLLRADPQDMSVLDGRDDRQRAELIVERLRNWKSIANA